MSLYIVLYLIYSLDPFPDRGVRRLFVAESALHASTLSFDLGCPVIYYSIIGAVNITQKKKHESLFFTDPRPRLLEQLQ